MSTDTTEGTTEGGGAGEVVGDRELAFKVPETLDELRLYLQGALEVEHLTIPPYLTAMYTIRAGTNQAALYAIRSIVLEEMLHLTLVANLLNAVGGTPRVAHPDFVRSYPTRLPYSALDLEIPLRHFSPDALRTFLAIERPQYVAGDPAPGSTVVTGGWTSIGQFYGHLRQGLLELLDKHGHDAVFSGPRHRQVGPEDFYNSGGEVFAVTDRASALKAFRVVTEQGEGVSESIWDSDDLLFGEQRQTAHYFRFNEILTGRAYGPHDSPDQPPSGPPVDVTWHDAYRIDPNASVASFAGHRDTSVYRHAVAFNACYARMLTYLEAAFTGTPRAMALAIPAMLKLRDLAERLYRNPHPDPVSAAAGCFGSATFEIEPRQFAKANTETADHLGAARLTPGEPIDLSGVAAG
ncbi:ferritin-like protein [Embleya sp. NBC_00896]|uniref:ferritin-like domain-containing protein n=1 Tax=Embleya sp. NBC_00896 TaxID=2975961 RepID=UPI00386D630F|nr:ferritin-like protein [Embleya sp. NBC_00896]